MNKLYGLFFTLLLSVMASTSAFSNEKDIDGDALRAVCEDCWNIASHIKQLEPSLKLSYIVQSSHNYAFRLALQEMCPDCYTTLTEKEISQNRLFSVDEAREYTSSAEFVKLTQIKKLNKSVN